MILVHKIWIDNRNTRRERVASLNGHISNVKCITSTSFKNSDGNDSVILVSAGGRAQLKVWLITQNMVNLNND